MVQKCMQNHILCPMESLHKMHINTKLSTWPGWWWILNLKRICIPDNVDTVILEGFVDVHDLRTGLEHPAQEGGAAPPGGVEEGGGGAGEVPGVGPLPLQLQRRPLLGAQPAQPILLVLLLPGPGGAEGGQALLGVEIQVDDGVQEAEHQDHSVQSLHHKTKLTSHLPALLILYHFKKSSPISLKFLLSSASGCPQWTM